MGCHEASGCVRIVSYVKIDTTKDRGGEFLCNRVVPDTDERNNHEKTDKKKHKSLESSIGSLLVFEHSKKPGGKEEEEQDEVGPR